MTITENLSQIRQTLTTASVQIAAARLDKTANTEQVLAIIRAEHLIDEARSLLFTVQ